MPRFFLDITTNGDLAQDEEGQEFSNEDEAHREAVLALAEIAADRIPEDGALYLAVTVCDEYAFRAWRPKVVGPGHRR